MNRALIWSILFLLLMGAGPGRPEKPYNIIVLSVDTLRADRLGSYGYSRKTSPNLDRLLAQGTVFTDAITNVPLTNPSFASLFTSRYSHEVGSIRNGIPIVATATPLAELMKKSGYGTAAIISNWPLKRSLSRLDRGFDYYEDDFHEKRWVFFNDERDARGVTECATDWLLLKSREPFFAWIHYSDPHAPYLNHKEFPFSGGTRDSDNYDSEVAYTDYWIGEFIKKLTQKKLLDRTLIVFLADHGESLGEHDYVGHGRNVYQPGLRVPLALIGPGIPAGKRSEVPVQLLDVAPTILGYARLEVPKEMRGLDLGPLLRGEKPAPTRTLFYETFSGAAPPTPGAEKSLTKPLWVGKKVGTEKVMFSVRYQKWEEYSLQADPGELRNEVKLGDPDFNKSSNEVLAWYAEWEDKAVVGEINLSAEDVKKLKDLGYLNP